MKKHIVLLGIICVFSSCYTTHVTVGAGPVEKSHTKVYSKSKQFYFLEGVFKLGDSQPSVPEHGNVLIETKFSKGDFLITFLTAGIISSKTTRVIVNKDE